MTYSRRCRDVALIAALLVAACGGSPSSPGNVTEARVVTDTNWSGTLGERGEMSGGGATQILNIGSGRQCATAYRRGSGFLTLRVGANRDSDGGSNVPGRVLSVCGEGLLRE